MSQELIINHFVHCSYRYGVSQELIDSIELEDASGARESTHSGVALKGGGRFDPTLLICWVPLVSNLPLVCTQRRWSEPTP